MEKRVKKSSKSPFYNFEQRVYDYEELERMLIRSQEELPENEIEREKRRQEDEALKKIFMKYHEKFDK